MENASDSSYVIKAILWILDGIVITTDIEEHVQESLMEC